MKRAGWKTAMRRRNSLYEQIADTFNGHDNGTRRYPR